VAEPKTVSVQIDADPRFAAAAGGAARYFGDSAGLESGPAAQLQAAVVSACEEAFEHLSPGEHLIVTFTVHPDRIEVALSHEGGAHPAVGLDTIAAGASVLGGVDRVQYETQGSRAVTLLTKYLKEGAPSR